MDIRNEQISKLAQLIISQANHLEILEMPTRIAGGGAIAGQLTGTGAHAGPALAAFVGDLAARLQHNRLCVGAIPQLIAVGERRQMLQICRSINRSLNGGVLKLN